MGGSPRKMGVVARRFRRTIKKAQSPRKCLCNTACRYEPARCRECKKAQPCSARPTTHPSSSSTAANRSARQLKRVAAVWACHAGRLPARQMPCDLRCARLLPVVGSNVTADRVPGPGRACARRDRPIAWPAGSLLVAGASLLLRQVAATVSFSGRAVFVACWWARLFVESTETVQSIPSIESAWAVTCARTVCHVSSAAHRRWRVQTVCQGPNASWGRSFQGIPVRSRWMILSTTRRWSANGRPGFPALWGRQGARRAHCSSVSRPVRPLVDTEAGRRWPARRR